ncbi:MAG: methylated-DNA--[protein]-cysteine S-methyltransferase [Armatimonadetes bacterium]|nr:methylated-DNA--[protein]-cysteine S-methyltransferase [Armatimonadota bacterium]
MAGELERYFHRELQRFETPIRLAGTPFERAVWEELLRIPFGETLSYAALAHRVGDPKATRAVGRANGANPLAIVVPCHRVVETGGGLGGYGGGLDRKRFLLDLESGQEALNYDLQNLENDSSDRGGEPRPQSGLGL